jgi:hypothetical protein
MTAHVYLLHISTKVITQAIRNPAPRVSNDAFFCTTEPLNCCIVALTATEGFAGDVLTVPAVVGLPFREPAPTTYDEYGVDTSDAGSEVITALAREDDVDALPE